MFSVDPQSIMYGILSHTRVCIVPDRPTNIFYPADTAMKIQKKQMCALVRVGIHQLFCHYRLFTSDR